MTLSVLPYIEAAVIRYLTSRSEVTAIFGAHVGAQLAAARPAAIVERWGGVPLHSSPLKFDQASIQISVYADTASTARLGAETMRAALAEWRYIQADPAVRISDVTFGVMHWMPDTISSPPEPRYIFDTTIIYSKGTAP